MISIQEIDYQFTRLGVGHNYRGRCYAVYALYLSALDPSRLQLVTKCLYPDVANYYKTNPASVERSIRTFVSAIWDADPNAFCRATGINLRGKPTASCFIALMLDYLVSQDMVRNNSVCNL